MSRSLASIAFLTWCLALPAAAQMRGGMGFGGGRFAGQGGFRPGNFTIGFHAHPSGNTSRRFSGAPFTGFPGYYADYPYEAPAAQPPQVIVVQPAAAPVAQPREDPKPPVPLMIERRGDRFVRYRGSEHVISDDRPERNQPDPRPGADESQPSANSHPEAADFQPASPVLLLLRDGRREEATSYAIINGVLYKYADQWNGRSWAEKIQLSDLDVPGTIRANRERGINFALPAAPNEIIARP